MNRIRRRMGDVEAGSLILAIAMLLFVSLMATALLGQVLSGQVQERHATRYENALQGAEVGLDRMLAQVKAAPFASGFSPITGSTPGTNVAYSVTATCNVVNPLTNACTGLWTVLSSGTTAAPKQTTRTIQAAVRSGSLFSFAVFGRAFDSFNGGNSVDSYNSAGGSVPSYICNDGGQRDVSSTDYVTSLKNLTTNSAATQMCTPTGRGVVGTNGRLFLKGQVAGDTDRMEIYNAKENVPLPDPWPNPTGYCDGVPQTCNQYDPSAPTTYDPAVAPPHGLYYYQPPMSFPDPTICNNVPTTTSFADQTALGPGVYGFTDVTLDHLSTITGTVDNPTILCVSGQVHIPNGETVRIDAVGSKLYPEPAGGFLIFSKYNATNSPGLDFGNHAAISAGIYAPNAAFSGGSQGNVYGSMIAGSVDNQGGWNFHYDEALANSKFNVPVSVSDWVELK
ncbi:MAG TPA: hypothetical protein VHE83_16355 [Mycobacteriales bacterium]|nr:hypothetical protein [Mycobacteriales bacterium]